MKFIVDVNLPKYFSFFNSPDFTHVVDIDMIWKDTEIWSFAFIQNAIIISKDEDFKNKFLLTSGQKPGVVYVNLGNISLKGLHIFFNKYWDTIKVEARANKLIIINPDSLEIIEG